MPCADGSHAARCGLCVKFAHREPVGTDAFQDIPETLAAECPYRQLQQSLVELMLEPKPGLWRRELCWQPAPWDRNTYVLEVRPLEYEQEYWNVYLEPGEKSMLKRGSFCSSTDTSCRLRGFTRTRVRGRARRVPSQSGNFRIHRSL
jgi:hypothetical protein